MKLRMRFSKKGMVKFIGHLDMMRYFQKAFRRAGLDVKYSQGFHPHQNLSFASPLGVGLESEGEYLDLEMNSIGALSDIKAAVNAQMTEGVEILSVGLLQEDAKNAMSIIVAADYTVKIREGMLPCSEKEFTEAVKAFAERTEIFVVKKTKKSEKEMDIRPLIYKMTCSGGEVFMQVGAGSAANLKPEFVMETMYSLMGWDTDPYAFMVTRLDMYTNTAPEGRKPKLVSLSAYQISDLA